MKPRDNFRITTLYEDATFDENIIADLVEKSNKIIKCLRSHKPICEKELKH